MSSESEKMMVEVIEQIRGILAGAGVPEEVREQVGASVCELIRKEWGGLAIYFPKSDKSELARRNKMIIAAAETPGESIRSICSRFNITPRSYRRILKKGT